MNNKDVTLYKITRPIITFFFKIIFTPKIEGQENIPKEGKIILAGNHTSNLDCLLLISSTKRNIHFLAKNELFKGYKKIIFSNMGLIPVKRDNHDHKALVEAEEYLKNHKLIGIFPEGTIGKDGLLPFKIGAVKMAKDTNTHIVPFVITGKYKLFSKSLKIKFLKEISIKKDLEIENNNLREKIKNSLEGE